MQKVIINKDTFNSFQKDELLKLDEAEWFTQAEGFIPLPRKCNRKNIYVLFFNTFNPFEKFISIYFHKEKVKSYRFSEVIDTTGEKIGTILSFELKKSSCSKEYYFY